ncbi:SDR family NAD(P)-dependent oxidoreductase [Streptomyces sp. L7]
MTNLTGSTAVITGSARGIGRAIALRYASLGANIVVNYASDQAGAEATAAQIERLGAHRPSPYGRTSPWSPTSSASSRRPPTGSGRSTSPSPTRAWS